MTSAAHWLWYGERYVTTPRNCGGWAVFAEAAELASVSGARVGIGLLEQRGVLSAKVIVRLKGGLGNQLFCYAAARRLALANDAELVIDDVTGFRRDRSYRRQYQLDHVKKLAGRKASPAERLEPFERVRRGLLKWINRRRPFLERTYVEQEQVDFDPRLLEYRVRGTVYLDGLWQSEGYFKDVEAVIRKDLTLVPPADEAGRKLAEAIRQVNAVAVHVRWFDPPAGAVFHNAPLSYYESAIRLVERKVARPQYFLFSDDPAATEQWLDLPRGRATLVAHGPGVTDGYRDLWLMTQCRHFIIANSTFSWWGAWLSEAPDKIVIAPDLRLDGKTAWGFCGLLPDRWLAL